MAESRGFLRAKKKGKKMLDELFGGSLSHILKHNLGTKRSLGMSPSKKASALN